MLMVLLYFIAVMLETGVGVWIFGKMFPKRKEYSKYRIAEKIVFFFIVLFTYTMLKGYLGIESNIKYFIAIFTIINLQHSYISSLCRAFALSDECV